MQTVTANETTIEIKGALYAVEAIDAGECGVSAVRVTKLVNGESYDVIRTHANVVECTCPDWVCRHEGKGTMCKHCRAAVVGGLLPTAPAPIAGGSPALDVPPAVHAPAPKPAFSPITPADLKRSSYFGIKLPASAPLAEAAPEIPATNPRDSWPAWCDEDRWTVSDEAPAVDEAPSPSWDAPRYEPESIEAAWWSGFQLGQEGEYPAPPKTMAKRDRYFFGCGRLAGFMESEDGKAWYADMEACRDRAFAEYDSYRDSEPRETDGYAAGYCS